MIKLQIIPMISSGENGSIDQRGKSFYCVKLYTNSKFNRSANIEAVRDLLQQNPHVSARCNPPSNFQNKL